MLNVKYMHLFVPFRQAKADIQEKNETAQDINQRAERRAMAQRQMVLFLKRPGGQSQFSAHLDAQSQDSGRLREVTDWIL